MLDSKIVEFHDARLWQVVIRWDVVSIEFSHSCVFVEVGPEQYECWSYRTTLDMTGVSSLSISGAFNRDDTITDGWIERMDGAREVMCPVDTEIACRGVGYELASGAMIGIRANRILLRAVEKVRFLEKWDGPLVT